MPGNKKIIPYGSQYIDLDDIKAVTQVLKSDFLTQGPKVREFEENIASYCGARFAVSVSSGTAALHLACLAAGIKSGDEAITSPVTFVASANCILYCGGRPVFADIQPDTVNIEPEEIAGRIRKKTKAVIPVHFSGHPCEMEEIRKIAAKHKLTVIEDAAHALGARYKGSKAGSCRYSDMTTLSFHPVKAITTGEGGAILTNRKDLYERLVMLRQHGITKDPGKFVMRQNRDAGPWYHEMHYLGLNYRLTDLQCALGVSQLKKLDKFVERRRQIAAIYTNELREVADITLPQEKDYADSAWHIYCIRLKNSTQRKKVFLKLREAGIFPQVHYIPVHLQPYYQKNFGYTKGDYPRAEEYYERALTLPLYPKLKDKEAGYVIKTLKKALKQ